MFQVFAQLIELRPAPLPAVYLQIFPPLLAPTFWERSGNVPALVRLLQVRAEALRTLCTALCVRRPRASGCILRGSVQPVGVGVVL